MSNIFTTREIVVRDRPDWVGSDVASYRIEIDLCDARGAMQRFIWTRRDGSTKADPWINGARGENADSLMQRGYAALAA